MRLAALTLPLAALSSSPATAAEPLPLRHGQYVMSGTPCDGAPFAAMMTYDGRGLGGPHDSRCVSTVVSRSAGAYRVATTCSGAGDGSPVSPTTVEQSITVRAPGRLTVGSGSEQTDYRWCESLR